MSKHPSQIAYEKAKARHKAIALEKEKMIQEDLKAIRQKYVPKNMKKKILTGCILFGVVYLTEELIFRKKIPGILKFTGAVAATVMAPRLFDLLQDNFLGLGENETLGEISDLPLEPTDTNYLEHEVDHPPADDPTIYE